MDIDNVLRERYVSDLRKPEIDNKERALIIKKVCESKGWSIREFAKQFGFHKSTVQDWLLWDDARVDTLKKQGASDTEIYKVLRNNSEAKKEKKGKKERKSVEAALVDERLRKMAAEVKGMVANEQFSTETKDLIAELVNQCNRFDSLIKRKIKK